MGSDEDEDDSEEEEDTPVKVFFLTNYLFAIWDSEHFNEFNESKIGWASEQEETKWWSNEQQQHSCIKESQSCKSAR